MAQFDLFENMYIEKALLGVEDITTGFGQENQTRAGTPKTPVTQVNASHFQGVLTFQTLNQLQRTDTSYLGQNPVALVKETGQFYYYTGNSWQTSPGGFRTLDTLEDLSGLTEDQRSESLKTRTKGGGFILNDSTPCVFVNDENRGGYFKFNPALIKENNGGTIFNGWVRLYTGLADVKWFGAVGDGITDDYQALQAALDSGLPLHLSEGVYYVAQKLIVPAGSYVDGSNHATIKFEHTDGCLHLKSKAWIKNINFEGKSGLPLNNAIIIDGEAVKTEASETLVDGCNFVNVGGDCFYIANVDKNQVGNTIQNCNFSNCGTGVNIDYSGFGVVVTLCNFTDCAVGFASKGATFSLLNSRFTRVSKAISLSGREADENNKCVIKNCDVNAISTRPADIALDSNSFQASQSVISDCVFGAKVNLLNTNKATFLNCDFSKTNIYFQDSGNNYFVGCITDVSQVTEYVDNTFSMPNYFNDTLRATNATDAGVLTATKTTDTFLSNSPLHIRFDRQLFKMPFLPNINSSLVYNPDTGIFDFTSVVSAGRKDTITCHLTMATNAAVNTAQVFIYKVNDESDGVQEISQEQIVACVDCVNFSSSGGYRIFTFSGKLPRGRYKIFAQSTDSGSPKLLGDKSANLYGRGKVSCKVSFYGV